MMYMTDDATEDELREMAQAERNNRRWANRDKVSVVMLSSTFLPGPTDMYERDSTVQITETRDRATFINIHVHNGPDVAVRIEPDEWSRYVQNRL